MRFTVCQSCSAAAGQNDQTAGAFSNINHVSLVWSERELATVRANLWIVSKKHYRNVSDAGNTRGHAPNVRGLDCGFPHPVSEGVCTINCELKCHVTTS